MSKKDPHTASFNRMKANIEAAKAVVKGDETQGRIIKRGKAADVASLDLEPVNVKAVRLKTGLNQDSFATSIGLPSSGTLKNWEQGRSQPKGPAAVLLNLIDRDPKIVQRILGKPA